MVSDRTTKIVGSVIGTLAIGAILLHALVKVIEGHGTETYRNYKGALLSYVGVIVAFAAAVVCIVVALALRWWQLRRERKLDDLMTSPPPRARSGS